MSLALAAPLRVVTAPPLRVVDVALFHGERSGGIRTYLDAKAAWRGAAWVNTAWLLIGGLRMLGADSEADALARRVTDAIERSGFREYYHPRTGSGHGEHRFGFSTLVLDLPAGFSPPPAGVAQTV